ncbi:hypothetical protein GCM10010252_37000 [Streptomyces aureoverticillatus]|nr:hypothetical protein GCM10010252_37000 [Streptomyces aureoverticillatus]
MREPRFFHAVALIMATAALSLPASALALPNEVVVDPPRVQQYAQAKVSAHACGNHAIHATGSTTAARGTFPLTKGAGDTHPTGRFTVAGSAQLGTNTVTIMCDTGADFTVDFTVLKGAPARPGHTPPQQAIKVTERQKTPSQRAIKVAEDHKSPTGPVNTGVGGSAQDGTTTGLFGLGALAVGVGAVYVLRRQAKRRNC